MHDTTPGDFKTSEIDDAEAGDAGNKSVPLVATIYIEVKHAENTVALQQDFEITTPITSDDATSGGETMYDQILKAVKDGMACSYYKDAADGSGTGSKVIEEPTQTDDTHRFYLTVVAVDEDTGINALNDVVGALRYSDDSETSNKHTVTIKAVHYVGKNAVSGNVGDATANVKIAVSKPLNRVDITKKPSASDRIEILDNQTDGEMAKAIIKDIVDNKKVEATYIKEDGAAAPLTIVSEVPVQTADASKNVTGKYAKLTVTEVNGSGADVNGNLKGLVNGGKTAATGYVKIGVQYISVDSEGHPTTVTMPDPQPEVDNVWVRVRPQCGLVSSVVVNKDVYLAENEDNNETLEALTAELAKAGALTVEAFGTDGKPVDVSASLISKADYDKVGYDTGKTTNPEEKIYYIWEVSRIGDADTNLADELVADANKSIFVTVTSKAWAKADPSDTQLTEGSAIDNGTENEEENAKNVKVKEAIKFNKSGADKMPTSLTLAEGFDEAALKSALKINVLGFSGYDDVDMYKNTVSTTWTVPTATLGDSKNYVLTWTGTDNLFDATTKKAKASSSPYTIGLTVAEYADNASHEPTASTKIKDTTLISLTVVKDNILQKVTAVPSNPIKIGFEEGENGKKAMVEKAVPKIEAAIKMYVSSMTGDVEVKKNIMSKAAYDEEVNATDKTQIDLEDDVYYVYEINEAAISGAAEGGATATTVSVKVTASQITIKDNKVDGTPVSKETNVSIYVTKRNGKLSNVTTAAGSIKLSSGAAMLEEALKIVKGGYTVTAYDEGQAKNKTHLVKEGIITEASGIEYYLTIDEIANKPYTKAAAAGAEPEYGSGKDDIIEELGKLTLTGAGEQATFTVKYTVKSYTAPAANDTTNKFAVLDDTPGQKTTTITVSRPDRVRVRFHVCNADGNDLISSPVPNAEVYVGKAVGSIEGFTLLSKYAKSIWYDASGKEWDLESSPVGDKDMDLYCYDIKGISQTVDVSADTKLNYSVDGIINYDYTGKAIKPEPIVRLNGEILPAKAYKVKFADAKGKGTVKNAGDYTATITIKKDKKLGIAKDFVMDKTVSFKVNPMDISGLSIADKIVVLDKNDKGKLAVIKSIKYRGTTLKIGTDYTYDVKKVTAVKGSATDSKSKPVEFTAPDNYIIEVKAKGTNFAGTSATAGSVAVTRADKNLAKAKITLGAKSVVLQPGSNYQEKITITVTEGKVKKDYVYTGTRFNSSPVAEAADGTTLNISYSGSVNKPGKVTVIVTGNGAGYFGSKTENYTIKKDSKTTLKKGMLVKNSALATLNKQKYAYTGKEITLVDIFTEGYKLDKDGKETTTPKDYTDYITAMTTQVSPAQYGRDFTVSYAKNILPGTATVTFTAIDGSGYSGSFKQTFKIDKIEMKKYEEKDGKPVEGTGRIKVDTSKLGYATPDNENFVSKKSGKKTLWTLSEKGLSKILSDNGMEVAGADGKTYTKVENPLVYGVHFTVNQKAVEAGKDLVVTITGKGAYAKSIKLDPIPTAAPATTTAGN